MSPTLVMCEWTCFYILVGTLYLIPIGFELDFHSTQLQSFDASKYSGNPALCGDPLPYKCPGEENTTSKEDGEDQDGFITGGFYVALGLGFVFGFWGICGSLLFIKSWRYIYFMFFNGVGDWIYVTATMHKAKLLRIISN